jgi:hypothetical protein
MKQHHPIAFDRAFELVLGQPGDMRAVVAPSRLDALFDDLRRADPLRDPN